MALTISVVIYAGFLYTSSFANCRAPRLMLQFQSAARILVFLELKSQTPKNFSKL
jgi:hypothetical protein